MQLARDASAPQHGSEGAIARVAATRLSRLRWAALGAALACGALVAGCGESDGTDPGSAALGDPDVKLTVREASCTDWNEASAEQRQLILESMAEFESGEPTGTVGRTLPEDEAYALFERACEEEYARAFKLYKVYVRAAAFQRPQQ